MLWALTKPVPDARTDFGAIFPLMVAITFIFDDEIVEVGVSLACTLGARKERERLQQQWLQALVSYEYLSRHPRDRHRHLHNDRDGRLHNDRDRHRHLHNFRHQVPHLESLEQTRQGCLLQQVFE